MEEANTREQMLWGQLTLSVIILIFAFVRMGFAPSNLKQVEVTFFLGWVFYFLGDAGKTIYRLYFSVPRAEDERDRLIKLKGTDSAHNILLFGIVLLLYVFAFVDGGLSTACIAGWLLYLLLLSFILSRIRQIRLYHFHEWLVPDSWLRNSRRRSSERIRHTAQRHRDAGKPES